MSFRFQGLFSKKQNIIFGLLSVVVIFTLVSWEEFGFYADADEDGLMDWLDNCPSNNNPDQADFDYDKDGDVCDLDDDNDGVPDDVDMFDQEPTEWSDFDLDSIGDNSDSDDDNDGVVDSLDFFDNDSQFWADFDFDGIASAIDPDDDNDGILDDQDLQPILPSEELTLENFEKIQTCAEVNDGTLRLLCYSQFFEELAEKQENYIDALELSVALSKMGTIDDCHFVSHEIGHVAFSKNQSVVNSLKGMDGNICRGGYFHGVLASYFHNIEESGASFPDSFRTICDDLIGTSNYQDCIHGLGHGLVHYFGDNLESSLQKCHEMSFYQNRLCVKGVMMQYTDNKLTSYGISKENISFLCDSSRLDRMDYLECSMSIGTTLAFVSNHDLAQGSDLCDLIQDAETKNLCISGLKVEIEDSEKYEVQPLTLEKREKFQPQFIENGFKVIDILSPAIISDFNYADNIGVISFSIDKPEYVVLYIPNELLSSKMLVAVNGEVPNVLESQTNVAGEDISMIRFIPKESGLVLIAPLR